MNANTQISLNSRNRSHILSNGTYRGIELHFYMKKNPAISSWGNDGDGYARLNLHEISVTANLVGAASTGRVIDIIPRSNLYAIAASSAANSIGYEQVRYFDKAQNVMGIADTRLVVVPITFANPYTLSGSEELVFDFDFPDSCIGKNASGVPYFTNRVSDGSFVSIYNKLAQAHEVKSYRESIRVYKPSDVNLNQDWKFPNGTVSVELISSRFVSPATPRLFSNILNPLFSAFRLEADGFKLSQTIDEAEQTFRNAFSVEANMLPRLHHYILHADTGKPIYNSRFTISMTSDVINDLKSQTYLLVRSVYSDASLITAATVATNEAKAELIQSIKKDITKK